MAINKLTSPVTQNDAINKINEIIDQKVEKSGDTMTGELRTSFNNVANGAYASSASNVADFINDVRYSSGCMGSVYLATYTKDGVTLPTGWYNYEWIPHRTGGVNGSAQNDNCNYGTLYLTGMNHSYGKLWLINYSNSSIQKLTEMDADGYVKTTGNQTVAGNKNFTGTSTIHSSSLIGGATVGSAITSNPDALIQSPIPKYLWHDVWANCRAVVPKFYTTTNKTTWTEATLNKAIFQHRQTISRFYIINSSYAGARWEWIGDSFAWSGAAWLVIGVAYSSTPAKFDVLLEASDSSGSSATWTTLVNTTGISVNASPVWIRTNTPSVNNVRLTITRNSESGNTTELPIVSLMWLTTRWGDQGKGSEWELPFAFDDDYNIATLYGGKFIGDLTGNATNVSGVVAADHGGTGKTTLNDSANVLINSLTTGSSTPTDNDYYVSQYVGGGTTTTSYHRRPMSALWEYIKGKISSVLGLSATSYGGNAATATNASTVNNHTVNSDVPANAKFTDTTYSVGTPQELAAGTSTNPNVWQPKTLNNYIAGASVSYATSAGSATSATTAITAGTADYALKLQTYKPNSTTETYGTSYPFYAQWRTNTDLTLKSTGYSTEVNGIIPITNRPSSANPTVVGGGQLRHFYASSSMTTAKPPIGDGTIIHLPWDAANGFDSQIAVKNTTGQIAVRGMNSGTWQDWQIVYDSGNRNELFTDILSYNKVIGTNADLNSTTYLAPGLYCAQSDSVAQTVTNKPTGLANAFVMKVSNSITEFAKRTEVSGNWIYRDQEITAYNGTGRWFRRCSTNGSGAWTYGSWIKEFPIDSVASADYAVTAGTATNAVNAENAEEAQTASYADSAGSASYATSAGNASTVNNHTVNSDVPANAKFTDTTYSVGTPQELAAGTSTNPNVWQPKTLHDYIAGASVSYATSAGSATSATTATTATKANAIIDANNGTNTITVEYSSSGISSASWFPAFSGYAIKPMSAGNVRTSIGAVAKAGDTMTGKLTLQASQYEDNYTSCALDLNNSNIQKVNGIYTADVAENGSEGINFYRTATTVDSVHANNGALYFTPNRTLGTAGTSYAIMHDGRTMSANLLAGGYLNIHPENSPVLIPFMHNDIAFLTAIGGSCVIKYDGTEQSIDSTSLFDGSPTYFYMNPTGITTITIELTLHRTFTYGNYIYVDFGSAGWRSKYVNIEYMTPGASSWTQLHRAESNSSGHVYCYYGFSSTGFNKLRFTFSDWNSATIFRIAQIGVVNYASYGLRSPFMSRGIDDLVYRNITPGKNATYDLGSSTYKWRNIYGNLTGNVTGSATSAGTATTANTAANVSTTGTTSTSTASHIWFSDASTETKRAHNDNFKYTPSTNTISANISGNAATATNASTVNNHTVNSDVPANAKFTDTTYSVGTPQELAAGTSTNPNVWQPKTLHDYVATYLPLAGGTMNNSSRVYFPQNSGSDTGIEVTNASTGAGILVGIGSGQENRGIYDRKLSKWMIYADASNIYVNGNATTATTATNVSTNGAATNSTARHIWFSDSGTETRRAHDDNFKYTPSTNTISANISGNAATATSATSATSATTATKANGLTTARAIDGVLFQGVSDITHYGYCQTAAGTGAKAVQIVGFNVSEIPTGSRVIVKFQYTNTAAVNSLTLSINNGSGANSTAKSIKYRGANLPSTDSLWANGTYEFIYDGTNWELVGELDVNPASYETMYLPYIVAGTSTTPMVITPSILKQAIELLSGMSATTTWARATITDGIVTYTSGGHYTSGRHCYVQTQLQIASGKSVSANTVTNILSGMPAPTGSLAVLQISIGNKMANYMAQVTTGGVLRIRSDAALSAGANINITGVYTIQ